MAHADIHCLSTPLCPNVMVPAAPREVLELQLNQNHNWNQIATVLKYRSCDTNGPEAEPVKNQE